MAADTRDELLGRLLGVPLDRFVEQRNRLAGELRQQGERETATWLAAVRRPSPGIWAIDQLARGDRDRVGALLDLSAELRAVQTRAMRGDREAAGEMRQLSARLQRALDEAIRAAVALLRDAGHGAGPDSVHALSATLRAALAAGEDTRRLLAEGLLLEPVEAAEGFGFETVTGPGPGLRVIEGGAARAPVAATPPTAAPATPPGDSREQQERERHLREVKERAESAARTAEEAEADARRLRERADELHRRAAEVRARIRAMEDDLHDAEVAARDADVAARQGLTRAREARHDAYTAATEAGEAPAD